MQALKTFFFVLNKPVKALRTKSADYVNSMTVASLLKAESKCTQMSEWSISTLLHLHLVI